MEKYESPVMKVIEFEGEAITTSSRYGSGQQEHGFPRNNASAGLNEKGVIDVTDKM